MSEKESQLLETYQYLNQLDGNYLFNENGDIVFYEKDAEGKVNYMNKEGSVASLDVDEAGNPKLFDDDGNTVHFKDGVPLVENLSNEELDRDIKGMVDMLVQIDPAMKNLSDIYGTQKRVTKKASFALPENLDEQSEYGLDEVSSEAQIKLDKLKEDRKVHANKGRYYQSPSREYVDDETGETFLVSDEQIQHALDMEKEHNYKMNSDLRIDGLKYRTERAIKNYDNPEDPFMKNYEEYLIQPDVDRDVKEIQEMINEFDAETHDAKFTDGKLEAFRELLIDRSKPLKLRELKYWSLYPKKVRQWVMYTKSTRGYYNQWGRWVPTDDMTEVKMDVDEEQEKENWIKWQRVFDAEQSKLDPNLRDKYRFGIQADEIEKCHPKIKYLFSMAHATPREQTRVLKADFVEKWKTHPTDTGSSQVQIAMLTLRIRNTIEYLKSHRSDKARIRVLQIFVSRRRSLMKHLKKHDLETYYALLIDLKLGDIVQLFKNNPQEKR